MNKLVYVYTDGSCNRIDKKGGIGVYIRYGKYEKRVRMGYLDTKIGRMEIKALITALRTLKPDRTFQFIFVSDSQYVINSINLNWLERWKQMGWCGIKNQDIWEQYLEEIKRFKGMNMKFVHVKGHTNGSGELAKGNTVADKLACYKTHEKYLESDLLF